MPTIRFSACRDGEIGDQNRRWHLWGEDTPGALVGNARDGRRLDDLYAQSGGVPFADQPAFGRQSRLAAHMENVPKAQFGPSDAPVVVFVHGFQFETREPVGTDRRVTNNPHGVLFHCDEVFDGDPEGEHSRHLTPWIARTFLPDGCGVAPGQAEPDFDGLAVSYGYSSYGDTSHGEAPGFFDFIDWVTPAGRPQNFYALAYRDAMIAGHGLAAVLSHLCWRLDEAGGGNRRIDIVCHSLGTRTVLKALEALALRAAGGDRALERIGRVLLLAGACLWEQAGSALRQIDAAPVGSRPEFYNILSDKDEVVRILGSRASLRAVRAEAGLDVSAGSALAQFLRGGALIGREGKPPRFFADPDKPPYRDWVDLDLGLQEIVDWGRQRSLDLDGERPFLKGDHWVHYTHRPNWELYRRILRRVPGYGAVELGATLPPARSHRPDRPGGA